jgi:hypothetical protein
MATSGGIRVAAVALVSVAILGGVVVALVDPSVFLSRTSTGLRPSGGPGDGSGGGGPGAGPEIAPVSHGPTASGYLDVFELTYVPSNITAGWTQFHILTNGPGGAYANFTLTLSDASGTTLAVFDSWLSSWTSGWNASSHLMGGWVSGANTTVHSGEFLSFLCSTSLSGDTLIMGMGPPSGGGSGLQAILA